MRAYLALANTRFARPINLAGLLLTLVGTLAACGRLVPASGAQESPSVAPVDAALATAKPSATPTAKPSYRPAPNSLGGRVVGFVSGGAVIESDGRRYEIDLRSVVDVWRETSVPASALEVGDDLFLNGYAGSPFVVRYVWANIGRVDGVIREVDATGMLIEQFTRAGGTVLRRIEFSRYIEYGAPDAPLDPADLVPGRTIGAVVYSRAGEPMRATRVW